MACARLVGHFTGLTYRDVRSMPMRDFNALLDQMAADIDEQKKHDRRAGRGRAGGSGTGERRTPVMT